MNQSLQVLKRLKAIVYEFLIPLLIRHFQPGIVLGDVHDQPALLLNLGECLFLGFRPLRLIRDLGQNKTGWDEQGNH